MIDIENMDSILQSMGINRIFYFKLVKIFLDSVENDIEGLQMASVKPDYKKIIDHSHAIKSSSATLRLEPILELTDIIQNNAEKSDADNLTEHIKQLSIMIDELKIIYENNKQDTGM